MLVRLSSITILSAACSSSLAGSSRASDVDAGAADASDSGETFPLDAQADGDEAAADACSIDQLPLLVDRVGDVVARLHVAITYRERPAALLVDTGSDRTFLQEPLGSPDPVPDAGTIQLGCATLPLIGRPEANDSPVQGLPSVGTLGCDMFQRGPTKLDFVDAQLRLHPPGLPFEETAEWPRAKMDLVRGQFAVHATVKQTDVRLLFDTGAYDLLLLGAQPEPGDTEVDASDAAGNVVKMYSGTTELTLGSWTGTVPVMRVPSWPYFEQTVRLLGGNIHGLLGLSAIGSGAVMDPDARELRVGRASDGGS